VPIALRTPRLLLREWRDDDRGPFAAISADPAITAWLPGQANHTASDAWIDGMRRLQDEHGLGYWAVELPGEASLIGAIGMSRARNLPFAPAVEIGWRLARAYWGRGYATEAARAVIDDGFGRLGLAEIVAFTAPANRASRRVMERLGMTRDPAEDFDHPRRPDGDPLRRHVLYRLRRPVA
jgi:ribosomal-protein-alanine N-acetyltransferase